MILKFLAPATLGVLAVAACGGSTSSSSSTSNGPSPQAISSSPVAVPAVGAVAVRLSDFRLVPGELTAPAGTIRFDVKNEGPTPHNLTIKDSAGKTVAATRDLRPGEAASLTITLAAGTYTAICSLPGHESLGMKDTLTVT